MKRSEIDALTYLYNQTSKHSNYQVLHPALAKIIPPKDIETRSRQELERWRYIGSKVDFSGKTVVDVGGNTGFFSFAAIEGGAARLDYYEGNESHSRFVEQAAKVLRIDDVISVNNKYLDFESYNLDSDVMLLLNVLHHIGDDYGELTATREGALERIVSDLNQLSAHIRVLVLQIGFNWKGDREQPLFNAGTKKEVIEFVEENTRKKWNIEHIGVASMIGGDVVYSDVNETNIIRDDSLGEFLNRPIFILKSKTI